MKFNHKQYEAKHINSLCENPQTNKRKYILKRKHSAQGTDFVIKASESTWWRQKLDT